PLGSNPVYAHFGYIDLVVRRYFHHLMLRLYIPDYIHHSTHRYDCYMHLLDCIHFVRPCIHDRILCYNTHRRSNNVGDPQKLVSYLKGTQGLKCLVLLLVTYSSEYSHLHHPFLKPNISPGTNPNIAATGNPDAAMAGGCAANCVAVLLSA